MEESKNALKAALQESRYAFFFGANEAKNLYEQHKSAKSNVARNF